MRHPAACLPFNYNNPRADPPTILSGDRIMKRLLLPALAVVLACTSPAWTQDKKKAKKPGIEPTAANVPYGKHERQVLDFWQAKSDTPTPLVLCIHGGGWRGGDKSDYAGGVKQYLDAGISVAAINYRYVQQAAALKIEPPVKAPLEDAARALQFIRSKSKEWNLDKKRIDATGGSAGACSSLWLAFHDDMADPKSSDPVARESTRLWCAAVNGAQTTLDPKVLREWMPNYGYGAHAFGLPNFQALYDNREKVLKWIVEYSPMEHVSKDDPPIYMDYGNQKTPPVVGTEQADPTHSAIMGIKLEEKLKGVGVECVLSYQGHRSDEYKSAAQFLIKKLKAR
jgi:acetyl esterase/lipase